MAVIFAAASLLARSAFAAGWVDTKQTFHAALVPTAMAAPSPSPTPQRPTPLAHPTSAKAHTPRSGSVRSVVYTEAYQKRSELGQHLAIKITPPGTRGKPGFVLVEAYNYSAVTLRAVDLNISMETAGGEELNANISANDVRPNLSGLTWLKLPEPKTPIKVVKAQIKRMAIFDNRGKRITLNHYIDIIH